MGVRRQVVALFVANQIHILRHGASLHNTVSLLLPSPLLRGLKPVIDHSFLVLSKHGDSCSRLTLTF